MRKYAKPQKRKCENMQKCKKHKIKLARKYAKTQNHKNANVKICENRKTQKCKPKQMHVFKNLSNAPCRESELICCNCEFTVCFFWANMQERTNGNT